MGKIPSQRKGQATVLAQRAVDDAEAPQADMLGDVFRYAYDKARAGVSLPQ